MCILEYSSCCTFSISAIAFRFVFSLNSIYLVNVKSRRCLLLSLSIRMENRVFFLSDFRHGINVIRYKSRTPTKLISPHSHSIIIVIIVILETWSKSFHLDFFFFLFPRYFIFSYFLLFAGFYFILSSCACVVCCAGLFWCLHNRLEKVY